MIICNPQLPWVLKHPSVHVILIFTFLCNSDGMCKTVFFITRTQQLHAHPNKQKGELLIRPCFTFLQARTQHKSSLPLKVKSLTEALINTWCLKGPFILSHLQSKVGLFSFPLEMALYGIFMMGQLWRFLPSGCALESFLWAKVGLSLSTDPFTSEV